MDPAGGRRLRVAALFGDEAKCGQSGRSASGEVGLAVEHPRLFGAGGGFVKSASSPVREGDAVEGKRNASLETEFLGQVQRLVAKPSGGMTGR